MASSSPKGSGKRDAPPEPRPSSSIVILNPKNEVLLLHRVRTSSSFASAHVFPGGNLDPFHDGDIPAVDSPARHEDGPAYRMGAVRECFEETGILLAKKNGVLMDLPAEERDAARKKIHGNEIKFGDWLKSIGGEPDVGGLVPFTRWLTPVAVPKRFTTQMYLYMLPISRGSVPSEMHVPTADGGIEHTAALFAPAQEFLSRMAASSIILFPPQVYLLHLVNQFMVGSSSSMREKQLLIVQQRRKLLQFLKKVPTAETEKGRQHVTASIAWKDKIMSPNHLMIRKSDGRVVLGLEKPGPELEGSKRGGDWERVALVKFAKGGPSEVEIRRREDVFAEEKKYESENSKL